MNKEETVAIYTKLIVEPKAKKRPTEVSKLEIKLEAMVALIEVLTLVSTYADS